MSGLKVENQELRKDLNTIKGQWESVLAKLSNSGVACSPSAPVKVEDGEDSMVAVSNTPSLSPAASDSSLELDDHGRDQRHAAASPPTASSSSTPVTLPPQFSRRPSTRQTDSLTPPNVHKDLFGRKKNASAWGPGGLSGLGRDLGVHATWVPEVRLGSMGLDGKPMAAPFDDAPTLASFGSGKNLNPKLDALTDRQKSALEQATAHLRKPTPASGNDVQADFFGTNPYALKQSAMEDYRSVLYAKLGHNVAGALQAKRDPNHAFPVGFRPAFFSSPTGANSSLLSGKAPREEAAAPSLGAALEEREREREQRQKASYVAGLATSTVFSRLASSFVDAFAGNRPADSTTAPRFKSLSADKVADVLAGKAELKVVPVDSRDPVDRLGQNLGSLDLKNEDAPSTASTCSFSEMVERALRKE
jgi:hypothetical protein